MILGKYLARKFVASACPELGMFVGASSMDYIWEKSVLRLSVSASFLPFVLCEIAAGPAVDDGLVVLDGLTVADWDYEERDPAPAAPADRVCPLR